MKALSDEELGKITGGVLTEEAAAWIERNRSTIVSRAPLFLRGLVDVAFNAVNDSAEVYDVPKLIQALKDYGIKADDLE